MEGLLVDGETGRMLPTFRPEAASTGLHAIDLPPHRGLLVLALRLEEPRGTSSPRTSTQVNLG